MGYYVRALCASGPIPSIGTLISWLADRGIEARAEAMDPDDQHSTDWQSFDLIYDANKRPIPVECNRDTGEESLARAEAQEFLDEVSELEESAAKQTVVKHLKQVRTVICCRFLGDLEQKGYDVNGMFLDYFVKNCGAIIQADGEGFYSDSETVLLET